MKNIMFFVFLNSYSLLGLTQEKNHGHDMHFMTFDLSFNNPNSTPLHILKVGIKNKVISGYFQCMSGGNALTPLADFAIEYWVGKDTETIINAEPILQINPKESIRFTISLVPDATGSCGYWATQVSAIVIFDDGTKFYSKEYSVTSSDYRDSRYKRFDDSDIFAALKNKNPKIRVAGLGRLVSSAIPINSKTIILREKIKDENVGVRIEALSAIKELKLTSLCQDVIEHLKKTKNVTEADYACKTLAKIGGDKCIEPILDKCSDTNFTYIDYTVKETLKEIGGAEVISYVNKNLDEKFSWTNNNISYKYHIIYDVYCELAIYFQNKTSIPILKKILSNPYSGKYHLLAEIKELQKENEIVKNPFVLSFYDEYYMSLKDAYAPNRKWALELVCMIDSNRQKTIEAISKALTDEDEWVRATAAKWAGSYKLQQFSKIIYNEYAKADRYKSDFCIALKLLGQVCNK